MYSLRSRTLVPRELPAATTGRGRSRKRPHVSVEYEEERPNASPGTSADYLGRPIKVEQPDIEPDSVPVPVMVKQEDVGETSVKAEGLSQCQWSRGGMDVSASGPPQFQTYPSSSPHQTLSHFNYIHHPSPGLSFTSPPEHYPWRPVKLENPDTATDLLSARHAPVLPHQPIKLEHPQALSPCQWPGQVGGGLIQWANPPPLCLPNHIYPPQLHHPTFPILATSPQPPHYPGFPQYSQPFNQNSVFHEHFAPAPPSSYPPEIKVEPQDDFIVWQPELGLASFQPPDTDPGMGESSMVESGGKSDGKSPRTPKVKRSRVSVKKEKVKEEEEGEVWVPPLWEEHLTNVKKMREVRNAPVDYAGAMSTPDPAAVNEVRRYQVLVSLMLSSQTKDQMVAKAMNKLKEHGLTIENILQTPQEMVAKLIYGVGFWKKKADYIKKATQILVDKFDGDIPSTVEGLVSLPGIGPKMAHLIMDVAWSAVTGIAVDTHVHRITNRLGWHKKPTTKPETTQANLEKWLPWSEWRELNWLLVGFGQQTCLPVGPKCEDCLNRGICPASEELMNKKSPKKPSPRKGTAGKKTATVKVKQEVQDPEGMPYSLDSIPV